VTYYIYRDISTKEKYKRPLRMIAISKFGPKNLRMGHGQMTLIDTNWTSYRCLSLDNVDGEGVNFYRLQARQISGKQDDLFTETKKLFY
jgi:hypothetical protein